MLDSMIKRWLDLVFWWLPKSERSQSEEPKRSHKPPSAAASEESETVERPPAPEARPGATQTPPASAEERPATAQERPAAAPERPAAERPAAERPAAPPKPPRPDDLTVIKGIGPAVQEKLRGLGIATFGDLAAADPDRLVDQLKGSQPISKARVEGWTQEARSRAGAAN